MMLSGFLALSVLIWQLFFSSADWLLRIERGSHLLRLQRLCSSHMPLWFEEREGVTWLRQRGGECDRQCKLVRLPGLPTMLTMKYPVPFKALPWPIRSLFSELGFLRAKPLSLSDFVKADDAYELSLLKRVNISLAYLIWAGQFGK